MFEHNLLMFIPLRGLRTKSFAEKKKKNYPPITFFFSQYVQKGLSVVCNYGKSEWRLCPREL